MSYATDSGTERPCRGHARLAPWRGLHFQRTTLGVILALPLIAVLVGLLAYPMLSAFNVSLQAKSAGAPGEYVGLANYIRIFTRDHAVGEILINTLIYATATVALKAVLGLAMAVILNENIVARNLFRGWLLLPWIAPTLVTALTWRWMFDQTGGVINFILSSLGLVHVPPAWLASKGLARVALIVANVWRGFPFFGVTLLAGLQSISPELYEAAEIDGATVWQRIRHITLPWLEPVLLIVVILSTIWTFNDFTMVWIMTNGAPGYSTHLFATYAYHLGFRGTELGYATAVSLVATPLLLLFIAALAPRMWRDEQ
jgi:multiple sugar transport system permease protein